MTTTTEGVSTRWVVLIPSLATAHWLDAIRVGASAAGLTLLVDGFGVVSDEAAAVPDIIVIGDVSRALTSGADSLVAIVPSPGSVADALEAEGEDHATAVISASKLLAEVSSLDARYRVIGPDQLRTEGGPLQLFSDLVVSVPYSEKAPQTALAISAKSEILRQMYAHGRVSDQASFDWPIEIFSYHLSALIDGRQGSFDLTGRPKFLVSGPYLWMPAGTWTARIRFSIDDDASKRRFRLDWGGVAEWTEQHCTPDHSGTYEMDLTHTFVQAQACEVRLLITEGCFSGRAEFHGATISRGPSPSGV